MKMATFAHLQGLKFASLVVQDEGGSAGESSADEDVAVVDVHLAVTSFGRGNRLLIDTLPLSEHFQSAKSVIFVSSCK